MKKLNLNLEFHFELEKVVLHLLHQQLLGILLLLLVMLQHTLLKVLQVHILLYKLLMML